MQIAIEVHDVDGRVARIVAFLSDVAMFPRVVAARDEALFAKGLDNHMVFASRLPAPPSA